MSQIYTLAKVSYKICCNKVKKGAIRQSTAILLKHFIFDSNCMV